MNEKLSEICSASRAKADKREAHHHLKINNDGPITKEEPRGVESEAVK